MIAQLNDIAQVWWQWMGSMFWQVSLLIIVVTALDMLIRKWAWPQVRYALWVLVFIKLIIPPTWQMPTSIVSWLQPRVEQQISVQVGTTDEAANSQNALLLQNDEKEAVLETVSWKTWLLSGWISGVLTFSLLLARKMLQFRNGHRAQVKENIPKWFKEVMTKTTSKLKLKKIPSVVFSKDVKSPAVYGLIKQSLILPEGYMEKLSKEQAEHVLMHELCHLQRGDLLVHWFCILIQIIYWFNPLLIWSRRQMRNICEICCDLSVANVLKEKTAAYRETLIKTARELFTESMEPSIGFLGIFEEPFRLVPRLKWLEKRSWENRKRRIATTIFTSLFMIICLMPMAGISQTSDYGSDEIISNTGQEKIEITSQDQILYEFLIMEADIDKVFDFGSTPGQQSMGMNLHGFKDGIRIDGKSFKDLRELIAFMEADPDVSVLSIPKVIAVTGSTATLNTAPSGGKLDEPGMQLKLTPSKINENNFITQEFEFKVIEGMSEEEPARERAKAINTTLMLKDGDTVLLTLIPGENPSSSGENLKNTYLFFTPRIIRKASSKDSETSAEVKQKPFVNPITGLITSRYGYRNSPFTNEKEFHSGIDIAASKGEPIHAAASGTVKKVEFTKIKGHQITIQHVNNYQTHYAQCEKILAKEGQAVKSGDIVATCGSSGRSTGPHLHFELRKNGKAIDPEKHIKFY
ncbi:M56 family metallopeptidase [Thermodesulfobacteriota bacterium]